MEFKFNLGQRVVVPGTKGLQGIVIGRKEFLDATVQPEFEIRWLGDDAQITSDTCPQDVLERAQPGFVTAQFAIRIPDQSDAAAQPKRKRPAKNRSRKKSKSRSRSRR